MSLRIGLLGGTFDPPHIGHLILAEFAADALGLDRLYFVPAADPPHKRTQAKTPVEHRLNMLQLALASNQRFHLSRVDIERPGPHYSVDMVRITQEQDPEAELHFVMGADSLRDLPKWNRPDEFIQRCHLAVMRRHGADVQPNMHDAILPGLAERVRIIDTPFITISSTEIAARVAQGQSIRYLVPERVLDYIVEHRLYVMGRS